MCERDPADEWAFRTFARTYPHEAYELDPQRFLAFVQTVEPGATRETVEAGLAATLAEALSVECTSCIGTPNA